MTDSNSAENQPEEPVQTAAEEDMQELIRTRAYELYVERGRIDGFAEEDWLRAESEVLSPLHGGGSEPRANEL